MEKNKTLTQEELQELVEWFEQKTLPAQMQLDKATYIPNLPETVERLFIQAEINYDNPKMQGCIYLLLRIKEKLGDPSEA